MYTIRLRAGPSRMATAYTASAAMDKAERWEADGVVVVTCANGETYELEQFRRLVVGGVDLDGDHQSRRIAKPGPAKDR